MVECGIENILRVQRVMRLIISSDAGFISFDVELILSNRVDPTISAVAINQWQDE